MPLNGLVVRKPDRQAPQNDFDLTPRQFRRYVDASGAKQILLHNGLRAGVASGRIMDVPPNGYLWTSYPRIPGQTRGDMAGFHKRGPDPLSVQALFNNGPGSQPQNPGGPGQIAGMTLINPMTG